MSHSPRDLTPITSEDARRWKIVGLERAHVCAFCGGPSEATVGYPEETAPLIWQIGICNNCLVDAVLHRFRELKHQRMAALGRDMTRAANEVREARQKALSERSDRITQRMLLKLKPIPDPDEEAEADRRLAAEEERIARKHDMIPGWSADEFERDYYQAWRESGGGANSPRHVRRG